MAGNPRRPPVSATPLPTFEDVKKREAEHFLPVVNRIQVAIVEGAGSRAILVNSRPSCESS